MRESKARSEFEKQLGFMAYVLRRIQHPSASQISQGTFYAWR